MPRSPHWIDLLAQVIVDDVRSDRSVVRYFVDNALKGGWEGWLQVAYARAVIASEPTLQVFNREITFPGTTQRCDLLFAGPGTQIWMELKTQRSSEYTRTVHDFSESIDRLRDLPQEVKNRDVLIAIAVLKLRDGDRTRLGALRREKPATIAYYALSATQNTIRGEDVTDNIRTWPINDGELLLATWIF